MVTLFISPDSVNQVAKVTGGISRTVAGAASEPGHAKQYADAFQDQFNAESETIRGYANDRFDAGDAVVAIRFADRRGNRVERYAVASTGESANDLEDVRVVTPERFENLERSVDEGVRADWYLSRNAAAELDTFVERFAARGRDPSQSYVAKTAAKFGDSVEGDIVDRMIARFEGG